MIKYTFGTFEDWKTLCNVCKEDFKNSKLSAIPITNRTVFKDCVDKKQIILAKNNEEIVGLIQFNKRKNGVQHITNLWVNKNYRNQRIGSKLLSLIPTPIQLNCVSNNPAFKFYLKNNFKIIGSHINKNNLKIIEMEKK